MGMFLSSGASYNRAMQTILRVLSGRLVACLPLILLAGPSLTGTLRAQHELTVTGVPEEAPFTVSATADPARLIVELQLERGWHAYARDVGGGDPIRLTMTKGSTVKRAGRLRLPRDKKGELSGRIRIEQWLTPSAGQGRIAARLNFMICDPMQCLPPIELSISGKIEPVRLLLVVPEKDAHAERIGKFLGARGFAVQTTSYKDVTAKACDAQDLVLADSKLFRKNAGASRKARGFPRTKVPIVAVGFLGTQLIEAQGLAMASGYI